MSVNSPRGWPFNRPTHPMTQHLKPLYIQAHLEGKPFKRFFIYNGVTVNILPIAIMKKLGWKRKTWSTPIWRWVDSREESTRWWEFYVSNWTSVARSTSRLSLWLIRLHLIMPFVSRLDPIEWVHPINSLSVVGAIEPWWFGCGGGWLNFVRGWCSCGQHLTLWWRNRVNEVPRPR